MSTECQLVHQVVSTICYNHHDGAEIKEGRSWFTDARSCQLRLLSCLIVTVLHAAACAQTILITEGKVAFYHIYKMLSSQTRYKIGETVWAHLAGYPWWPAKIVRPPQDYIVERGTTVKETDVVVEYFNYDHQISVLPTNDVRPFRDKQVENINRGYDGPYKEMLRVAVEEALHYVDSQGWNKEAVHGNGALKEEPCPFKREKTVKRTIDAGVEEEGRASGSNSSQKGIAPSALYANINKPDLMIVVQARDIEIAAFKRLIEPNIMQQSTAEVENRLYGILSAQDLRELLVARDIELRGCKKLLM